MGTLLSAAAGLILAASLYPSVLPSVVYLRADPDGVGTGWVVDAEKRLILTCRHVVGEQTKLEVFFPAYRDGRLLPDAPEYLGRRARRREEGALVTGKVLRTSDALDLALIEVPAIPRGTRALPLAETRPSLGQFVLSVGHRGDLDTLWNATVGSVRQRGQLAEGYFWQSEKLAANLPALVLQAPIEEGDSGGPVLNGRGEVVGMISALRRRTPLAAVGPDASAIRVFLNREEPLAKEKPSIAEEVARSTVWIRPTASDTRTAGVVIDAERRLVLTSAVGVGPLDRVGMTFARFGKKGELVGEREAYKDGVELDLAQRWAVGTVVHRDLRRDLALVRLDALPAGVKAVSLADRDAAVSDRAIAISHPVGLEFAFVASAGTLRQRGTAALGRDGSKAMVNLFQLPGQSAAAGGPICTEHGQLLGVLAAKDAPQQLGYAASVGEVRAYLAEAHALALRANVRKFRSEIDSREKIAGWALAAEALRLGRAGKPADAKAMAEAALKLHPACPAALAYRAEQFAVERDWPAVVAACDALLAAHPQHREALFLRANAGLQIKEAKRAIGDLHRWLDVVPADVEFRQVLAKCYEATGEPAKAAEERARVARLKAVQK